LAYKRKTWLEKMADRPNFPKQLKLKPNFPCGRTLIKWGAKKGDSVVLVQPSEVKKVMDKVAKGKLITLKELCKKLAKKHKAKWCCTLTTGIQVVIIANATVETKDKTPWWRTLKNNGELNLKYPSGQKRLLEKEGHKIIRKGKRLFVKDYEKFIS
jgi:alkylated DNA nucleotide flippase Atl1